VKGGLFFDRDNTLNVNGGGYVADPNDIHLCPYVREVLREARKEGYLLFLITNQSGVGRGYFPLAAVEACNRRLIELIGIPQVFQEIKISTGTPDNPDDYRKPSPKFINEMILRYDLHRNHCCVIGDQESDMLFAANGHIPGILIGPSPSSPRFFPKTCLGQFPDLRSAWHFFKKHLESMEKTAHPVAKAIMDSPYQ
jgi:D-glycero-D-manno-heptose 1,7-bisphosphate phosphatase